MFKISKDYSVLLSLVLCVMLLAALAAGLIFLPSLLRYIMYVFDKPDYLFVPSVAILYAAMVPAAAALVSLFMLLKKVRAGIVFTASNVARIRLISWCCLAESLVFFSLGMYYFTSFGVSLAMLFMGLIVRVVKNIVEEAVALKHENDFTI